MSTKNFVRWASNSQDRLFFQHAKEAPKKNYVLLIVPVTTFGLGVWQLYRLSWKLGLIDERTTRTRMPPLEFSDLPNDIDKLRDLEYRRVKLTGTFDHDREAYVYPRSPVNSAGGGLISNTSSHGGHVITPFRIADTNTTVLFDRGWVPKDLLDPKNRRSAQLPGEVTVTGVLRNSERRNKFTPESKQDSRVFHSRDIDEIAQRLGTAPVWLDATADTSVPGGPTGGQTIVQMRNEHLSYAITWFTLSVISAMLWYYRFVKRKTFR